MMCDTELLPSKSTRPSSVRRAVRRDALHNREKILTVAAELVSQRGSNVPLAEIAEAAGVGVGTFYRGYPDHTAPLHALEQRAYTLLYGVLGSPRQASCARSAGERLVDSSDKNGDRTGKAGYPIPACYASVGASMVGIGHRELEAEMWYLTFHRWIGDRDEAITTSLDDHLAWMREQQLAGKVLFSGPSLDGELGIIVFGHMSRAELDDLCGHEPFVARGYRSFEVISWEVHQLLGIGGFDIKTISAMTRSEHA